MREEIYRERRPVWELWAVVGITLLAAGLRFYALGRLPPGLYHDEAYNGLDALRVLAGERPIFFEANNGREPLFIYGVAASVALWGRSPGAIRFVSACLGTLTVPATYLMARAMFGRRVGWLTALLAATTFWPLNLSRVGFRAVSMPLCTALTLWCFWRALRRGSWCDWAAAGALCGLMFYTYLAARFTVVVWALVAGYLVIAKRRHTWAGLVCFALSALGLTTPLLIYALGHYEAFLQRAAQISMFAPAISGGDPWGTLLRQGVKSLLMFIYRGDFIPRHNLPYRPVFDPLIAPFFVVGVTLSVRGGQRERAHAFALAWVGVMLLPTILAEGAPHFLRGVGVLPVALVFPAVGLETAYRFLRARLPTAAAGGLLGLLLAASTAWTGWDYFGRHVRSEAAYYNFEAGATELAARINRFLGQGWDGTEIAVRRGEAVPGAQVYLDRRLWDGWASLRYLVPGDRVAIWSPDRTPQPVSASEVLIIAWPYADYRPALTLLPERGIVAVEEGSKERGDLEAEARLLYVAFTGRREGEARRNAVRRFQGGITLLGYAAWTPTPTELRVRLFWQVDAPLAEDWNVFVHARRGGQMLGQDDGPPGAGFYPISYWRPGEIVVDEHGLDLVAPYRPSEDEIWVGLYLWETGERLRVMDHLGNPSDDHVALDISP